MFFILLAVVAIVLIIWLAIKEKENIAVALVASFLISCIIFFMGVIFTEKYQDDAQYICETELLQLDSAEYIEPVYVLKSDKWKYLYKPIGSKEDDERTLEEAYRTYIDIVQSDKCEKPVLKEYVRETKWGIFSIGGISRIEYVFYIPVGTYQGLYTSEYFY